MFGDVLPLALGIAVSPVPVIATILMLLSPRAKATSAAFAGGWVGGITVAIVVFDLLGGLLPDRSEDSACCWRSSRSAPSAGAPERANTRSSRSGCPPSTTSRR
jgi:MFS family permease